MENISHVYNPSIDPVQQMVEEAAISKLESYYVMAVDLRNFASMSKVFIADVVADYGPGIGVINGVETLSKTLEQMSVLLLRSLLLIQEVLRLTETENSTAPVLSQHLIGSQVITLTSPTTANAISYVVANQFGKGEKEGIPLYAFPMYEDKLAKGADGWKITHRKLTYMVSSIKFPGAHAGTDGLGVLEGGTNAVLFS